MDTKTLHDWANEGGLNLRDDDGYQDAIGIWIDAAMGDASVIKEYLGDWLYQDDAMFDAMLGYTLGGHKDAHAASKVKIYGVEVGQSYCVSATQQYAFSGMYIGRIIFKYLEKYVEENAEHWWADVQGYAGEMEEGQYEDYVYQDRRDRMLDND